MIRYGTGFVVDAAFFTHSSLGIIGFLRTLDMTGRTEKLALCGPPAAKKLLTTAVHFTGREAGHVAREAGVLRLVLTHVSSRYDVDPSKLLAEAREEYKRQAEVAYDGFSVELPLRE